MKKLLSVLLCFVTFFGVFTAFPMWEADAAVTEITVPYYYTQLSRTEKEWYDTLRAAVMKQEDSVSLPKLNDVQILEKLWYILSVQDIEGMNLYSYSYTTADEYRQLLDNAIMPDELREQLNEEYNRTDVWLFYRFPTKTAAKMRKEIDKKLNSYAKQILKEKTSYRRILKAHDLLVKNVAYDNSFENHDMPYYALIKKKAACGGYSRALSLILNKVGITNVVVYGYANDDYHAWNKVLYKGNWYIIDSTWDDEVDEIGLKDYSCFMRADSEMLSHSEETSVLTPPKAADESKGYYEIKKLYAKSLSSAKSLIKSKIIAAAKNNRKHITVEFANDDIYNRFFEEDSTQGLVWKYIDEAKKYNSKLTDYYFYSYDENTRVYKITIMYSGTSINDYFHDCSWLDNEWRRDLKELGIAA